MCREGTCGDEGESKVYKSADDLYDQLRDVFRKIAGFYEEKKEGYHLLVLSAVYRLLYFLYTEGIRSEEDTETAHGICETWNG